MTTAPPGRVPSLAASMKRNKALVIAVIVIVLLVALSSILLFSLNTRDGTGDGTGDGTRAHHYYVGIEANTTEEYVIRLPVPVNSSGRMPPYFIQDIEVLAGFPALALGEFEYGKGLEIRASGFIELEWRKTWPESWNNVYGNLTMTTGAEGWTSAGPAFSWIFSDRLDIRIHFSYSCINHHMESPWFASGGGPTFGFYMYPDLMGWQNIHIDYGWLLIN